MEKKTKIANRRNEHGDITTDGLGMNVIGEIIEIIILMSFTNFLKNTDF
jgi:hypothetical protein